MYRLVSPEDFPITLVIAQPDIRLALDVKGVIRNASLSDAIPGEEIASWVGRPWGQTVEVGGDEVRRMLEAANRLGASAFGQVVQQFPSGRHLPIEYTTVRLGEGAGLVAVGKNLAAVSLLQSQLIATQHEREQEYWKLRDVETRYQLLFEASNEAIVVLRADNLRILEVNPEAAQAFGLTAGDEFERAFSARGWERLRDLLSRTREQGRLPAVIVHLGDDEVAWVVRASLVPSGRSAVFVMQMRESSSARRPHVARVPAMLDDLADRMPDAFLVIDQRGLVCRANLAFVDLVQAGAEGAVLGQHLGRWLRHPGADIGVVLEMIGRHGVVRRLGTTVYGQFGDTEVEISAVGSSNICPLHIGLLLRNVSPRREPDSPQADLAPHAARAKPAKLAGTPMLKRVRETTQAIERDYILAALKQVGGNRSAAAELLGMSRQTLYMKLGRYGPEDDLPLPYGRSV